MALRAPSSPSPRKPLRSDWTHRARAFDPTQAAGAAAAAAGQNGEVSSAHPTLTAVLSCSLSHYAGRGRAMVRRPCGCIRSRVCANDQSLIHPKGASQKSEMAPFVSYHPLSFFFAFLNGLDNAISWVWQDGRPHGRIGSLSPSQTLALGQGRAVASSPPQST